MRDSLKKIVNFLWMFLTMLAMDLVCPRGKQIHFQVQTSAKEGKLKFYQFSCASPQIYFVIQNFLNKMEKYFHGRPLIR